MIERVIRLGAIDPTVATMHEARLLATIPTLFAQHKHCHTTSIGNWWENLKKEDELYSNALASYISKRTTPPDGYALKELIDKLYASGDLPAS